MATRTLYAGQKVRISPVTGNSLSLDIYLPVSQANCEVSRPIEFMTSFGHIGNVAAAQNNFTTCKSSVKTYLTATGGLTAANIAYLTGNAIAGTYTTIEVTPNGFIMSGILSSLGIEGSVGDFATADLSFNGLGEPNIYTGSASTSVPADQSQMPTAITPVVGTQITGGATGAGCANSFKFSLDIPNEPLACLGDQITGTQTQITNSVLVAKFPLKTSITLEGYGVDVSSSGAGNGDSATLLAAVGSKFYVGNLGIQLPSPKITSKSFNNAVGSVGASYNVSIEDTNVNFS